MAIAEEIESSYPTVVDWASFCREVVFDALITTNSCRLGGYGRTVEIDESKFGKRKFHRGHQVDGQWVFGGIERETGRVFLEVVPGRSAEILVPIIKKWIEPGTTIISDCWKAYDCLQSQGFQHLKVKYNPSFRIKFFS